MLGSLIFVGVVITICLTAVIVIVARWLTSFIVERWWS